ncbi:MAG TPA: dicarboxylate/amino acid:cation symporter [Shinella sp.]|jgi:Na+/H+-dicarboxylate symporter|uniref:dicarboxylate/amino acid:cation symporter n=1 Tax=Shinella sp. TaxID=1870904 RepID=UPI0029ADEFD8|nr:dicarboxylate/amino acid:cation symporter [Shinella sp.]MDX3975531.1 dicarboxylate/amino acid:cation symporter [Shinella sp.]HEV7247543.1 dicarboxylate/amino acid:cation symporter [Shinella sp.]
MIETSGRHLASLLLHPASVFAGLPCGAFYGWIDAGASPLIESAGQIYLRLLQMCFIPLLFSAVVTSLAKLFSSGAARRYLGRLVCFFAAGLALSGGLGLLLGEAGQPGVNLQHQARQVIGEVIFRAEAATGATNAADFMDIAIGIVPENIFVALSSGNMLAILFFALLFGVALGSIDKEKSERAIALFESLYDALTTIIGWLIYILPIGLFCLAYSQVSSIGLPILIAMLKLVLLIYAGGLVLVLLSSLIVWRRLGGDVRRPVSALREAAFVAFGTSSSFAALPAALRGLKRGLGMDRDVVDLVMPLGITLNPPGSVFHFAIATVFLANLYGVDLDAGQMAFILLASVLAGLAAAGAPGVAALSMMSLILIPLGLPVEVAIILLVAIDPIVDPVLTVVNVQANAATTVLLATASDHDTGTTTETFPLQDPAVS